MKGDYLVDSEETPDGAHDRDEVVADRVEALRAVLGEDGVPPRVEDHVVLDEEVVDAMDRDAAVEGVVDRAVPDVAQGDVADHVEVDGVLAELEALPRVPDLDVAQLAQERVVHRVGLGAEHDLGPELLRLRELVVALQCNASFF